MKFLVCFLLCFAVALGFSQETEITTTSQTENLILMNNSTENYRGNTILMNSANNEIGGQNRIVLKYKGGIFAEQWEMGTLYNDDFVIQATEFGDDYIAIQPVFTISKDQKFVGISASNPKAMLHISHSDWNSSSSEQPALLVGAYANSQQGFLTVNKPATDTNSNVASFRDAGVTRVNINTNGDTYAMTVNGDAQATGMWVNSDKRLKKDINSLSSQLGQLHLLRPTQYHYNSEGDHFSYLPKQRQFGLIAQELQKVYPHLVKSSMETSEDGTAIGEFLSINYNGLVPVLISSVQEIDNKMKEKDQAIIILQEENKLLKSRLERIEKLLEGIKTE